MIISKGERKEIQELLVMNDKKGDKKLFKLYNANLETIDDKYFVLINLAITNKRYGNLDTALTYLNELLTILDKTNDYKMEKAISLWLYIELKKNDLTKDELLNTYYKVYDNIKHLGEYDENVLATKGNIAFLIGDYNAILDIYKDCLNRQYIGTSTAILNELKNTNALIYNKALLIENLVTNDAII